MFLKRRTRRKNGKTHTYWELVESYRTSRGSRHRKIAYHGKAASRARQLSLFECDQDDDDPVPDEVAVDLRKLHVENSRDFADINVV